MKLMPRTYDVFNEFFDDVFDRPVLRNSASVMKTDVHEKDGSYILDIDLPGYKKEDVNIELDKGYLTISAKHEVSDEEKDSKGNIIRQERSFGSCSRSFYVGDQIKPETISAKYENGVLKLNVPYEQPKPQVTNTKIMID